MTVAVVVLTLIYYGFNFVVDCLLIWRCDGAPRCLTPSTPVTPTPLCGRPETAVSLFVCGRGVERARQALIAARKGGSASNPNRAKRQAATLAKAAGGGDDDAEGASINMVLNPAMLAQVRSTMGVRKHVVSGPTLPPRPLSSAAQHSVEFDRHSRADRRHGRDAQ